MGQKLFCMLTKFIIFLQQPQQNAKEHILMHLGICYTKKQQPTFPFLVRLTDCICLKKVVSHVAKWLLRSKQENTILSRLHHSWISDWQFYAFSGAGDPKRHCNNVKMMMEPGAMLISPNESALPGFICSMR